MKSTCYFLLNYHIPQKIILNICQQSTLHLPKLFYAENFSVMRYEYVHSDQPKCTDDDSLKIVNCNEHQSQSIEYFFKMYKSLD